jgi:Cu/Ag efflux protein CusF
MARSLPSGKLQVAHLKRDQACPQQTIPELPENIMRLTLVGSLVLALASHAAAPSHASQKALGAAAVATVTATIKAIDSTNRLVTLAFEDGTVDTVSAGPEVRRFSELKVGDKVTFRYQESAVVQLRKPGDVTPASSATQGITRSAGAKPGGTMAQQVTARVTVEAIDAAVPSISVKTDDGRHVTYHVEDKKNLEGVKAGDRLDITLTRALMVSVADGKADAK